MTAPTTCPLCGAPVERERHDRGVWRLFHCTACRWSDAVRKEKTR